MKMKPPVGIIPRDMHVRYRIEKLKSTIERYEESTFPVNQKWIEELADLEALVKLRIF